jgi:hypothetical protein
MHRQGHESNLSKKMSHTPQVNLFMTTIDKTQLFSSLTLAMSGSQINVLSYIYP